MKEPSAKALFCAMRNDYDEVVDVKDCLRYCSIGENLFFLAVILIDMDSKKSLLMNVSKDEMDTIDEILQSRQTGSPVERRTSKLILTSPQYLISVPGKVKAPVNIPIKTIGALYELNTDWESKHLEETLEIDIEKDNNYKPFHSTSKIFEDLISLEHNYAIKLPYSPKRESRFWPIMAQIFLGRKRCGEQAGHVHIVMDDGVTQCQPPTL
ncbi:hypothetical protein CDAR_555111 [Caerostris darwini]|uniref:Uncharacterized protein n=1 Tax=Caerostris darwini TaxID=1538125 RepID=A0AAV4RKI4_9ARAC|nr:hypothetical protein CDAR_555111 [Caerostris darwini]